MHKCSYCGGGYQIWPKTSEASALSKPYMLLGRPTRINHIKAKHLKRSSPLWKRNRPWNCPEFNKLYICCRVCTAADYGSLSNKIKYN